MISKLTKSIAAGLVTILIFTATPRGIWADDDKASGVKTNDVPPINIECPKINPPQILIAKSIDKDENLILVQLDEIHIGLHGQTHIDRGSKKASLKGVVIYNAQGDRVSTQDARQRISNKDTPILATAYGQTLPLFYRRMVAKDVLHFAFPAKMPQWKPVNHKTEQ